MRTHDSAMAARQRRGVPNNLLVDGAYPSG